MGLKQKVQKEEEKLERNEQDMKITSRKKINWLKRLYQEGDYPIRELGGMVAVEY